MVVVEAGFWISYIAERPLLLGVRWFKMVLSLSVTILYDVSKTGTKNERKLKEMESRVAGERGITSYLMLLVPPAAEVKVPD